MDFQTLVDITPTDDDILHAIRTSNRDEMPLKHMLTTLRKEHPNWILGRKRLRVLCNVAKESSKSFPSEDSENLSQWKVKAMAVDSPVSSKNIVEPSTRVAAALAAVSTNWAISVNATSPGDSAGDDSDWEAPESVFIRPGSGLKPTRPTSLHKDRYDGEEDAELLSNSNSKDEKLALLPRSITFVPEAFQPSSAELSPEVLAEPEIDAHDESAMNLKKETIIKLKAFFERKDPVDIETKERVVQKLAEFFNRPREPVLPLANIETKPLVSVSEDDPLSSCCKTSNRDCEMDEDKEESMAGDTCNACNLM